jgi:uncharacterized protein
MKFWDTSAVVPLLIDAPSTPAVQHHLRDDPGLVVWWATPVECTSALARLERDGALDAGLMAQAFARLDRLELMWTEIQPGQQLRSQASRLLRVHSLTAADALQLAAALTAAEGNPHTLPLVVLDERLAAAAQREGFPVVTPRADAVS